MLPTFFWRHSRTLADASLPYLESTVLAIDHVILPVRDLAVEAAGLKARYGLASVEGGRHPAWGTANWIVPLGDTYLELVAVADNETAGRSDFEQWIASAIPGRPLGWAVRTNSIDAVGRRLGQPVVRVLESNRGVLSSPGGAWASTSRCASPGSRSSFSGEMACLCLGPRPSSIGAARRR